MKSKFHRHDPGCGLDETPAILCGSRSDKKALRASIQQAEKDLVIAKQCAAILSNKIIRLQESLRRVTRTKTRCFLRQMLLGLHADDRKSHTDFWLALNVDENRRRLEAAKAEEENQISLSCAMGRKVVILTALVSSPRVPLLTLSKPCMFNLVSGTDLIKLELADLVRIGFERSEQGSVEIFAWPAYECPNVPVFSEACGQIQANLRTLYDKS